MDAQSRQMLRSLTQNVVLEAVVDNYFDLSQT